MAEDAEGSAGPPGTEESQDPEDPLADTTPRFSELIGLEITDVEDGYSRGTLEVAEELTNPYGGLHGAVVYAMADTGMGAALVTGLEPGERMATIEIKISYLRPVTSGTVTCETTVLNRGRSVAYLESEVQSGGQLVARASGSFSIFER